VKSDLRTLVICWLIDRSGRERVDSLTLDQIRARRADPVPHWWPASLLTGAVARGVRITERDLPLDAATLPARVYTPSGAAAATRPLVVFFHGGGWVLGHVASYDALCSQIAAQVGAVVVSVGYRLAPEHRMPTAAEDAYAATVWLAANADQVDADGSRVAVAGDSAGGNIAAVVALLARDRGGPAIAHQSVLYAGTDGTLSSPSLEEHANGPILTLPSVRAYRALYLGPDGDERDERMSPLLAEDLSNLAPALVQTAELDPIRDDGRRYAAALRAAGNDVRFTEYVGAPHGYLSIPGAVRGAKQALAELVGELRRYLDAGSDPASGR
jgi:acetyl esterase